MKYSTFYIFIVIMLLGLASGIKAQDPIFSQSYPNNLYINPALAGAKNVVRFAATNRLQWLTPLHKLTINSVGVDFSYKNLGVGLLGAYDISGSAFRYTTAGGAVSYQFGKLRRFIFRPGVQFAYINRTMNWDEMVFYDQLSPYGGVVYDASQAEQPYENINLLDISAGGIIQMPINIRRTQPAWLNLGMAFQHLKDNKDAYIGIANNLYPRKFTLHGGLLFPLYKKDKTTKLHELTRVMLYPNFRYEAHGEFSSVDANISAFRAPFIVGLGLRTFNDFYDIKNANQLMLMVGYEGFFGNYTAFNVSYNLDFAFSGLTGKYVPAFTTHEFSIVVLLANKRPTDCVSGEGFNKNRWFDSEKTQRRFNGECPPGRTKRRLGNDIVPVFYPIELPIHYEDITQ